MVSSPGVALETVRSLSGSLDDTISSMQPSKRTARRRTP